MIDREEYDALVQAHGSALTLLVSMLGRSNVFDPSAFARHLLVLAVATEQDSESSDAEALILGGWANMVQDFTDAWAAVEKPTPHH